MNGISFYGGETAGSVAKRNVNNLRFNEVSTPVQTPKSDTVNFRGRDDEGSSVGSTIGKFAFWTALIVGGLGFAHKKDWVSKIKNQNLQKYAEKITKPCYEACIKVKDMSIKLYEKIKNIFSKNK